MKVEYLIYIYGAVCAAMVFFNIIYVLTAKAGAGTADVQEERIKRLIAEQLSQRAGDVETENHKTEELEKTMKHVNGLMAFDSALKFFEDDDRNRGAIRSYKDEIEYLFLKLALYYEKEEDMKTAYYLYFLSEHISSEGRRIDSLQKVVLSCMRKRNLYCKVNGLKALMVFGHVDNVIEGIRNIDRSGFFVHEKILTESLLEYRGDKRNLAYRLLKEFQEFSPHMKHALLNYIRFYSGSYGEQIASIMRDENEDKEVRMAAIRYFGKYRDESVYDDLKAFASDSSVDMWEYRTVSISAIALYRSVETVGVLKDALHSSNWYVRRAAAIGLDSMNVSYDDMMDVLMGDDRYAREMMMYRLEGWKNRNDS